MRDDAEDLTLYKVVVNHEEQYSIWPADRENPAGWRDAGKQGKKDECLAFVKEVWTDMRPLSLRKAMEEAAAQADRREAPREATTETSHEPEEDLVTRLCRGDHPVEASLRPEKTSHALRAAIDRDYVHVRFTNTRGGTELGFKLDPEFTDLSRADFQKPAGQVRLAGKLTLDYVRVRCVAEIDLETMSGVGHLERLDPAT